MSDERNISDAQAPWKRRVPLGFLAAGGSILGLAVACDALWVEDIPRPALAEDDQFDVSPPCPVLALDSTSIAAVEPTIAITARRRSTNLGAESVPVIVHIGSCACDSADASPDAKDNGSVLDAGPDGSALRCGARNAPNSCAAGMQAVDPASAAGFELVATQACQQASSTTLDCTLDSNGQASFRVRSVGSGAQTLIQQYLPVCVRPAVVDSNGSKDTEIRVLPRLGTARLAAAIAPLADPTTAGPDGGSCAALNACDTVLPRGRFTVGVIGADTPARAVHEDDFVPLLRDVAFSVSVSPTSSDVVLTKGASCRPGADAGDGSLALEITQGQRESEPFLLCALPTTRDFRLTATLRVQNADAGTTPAATEVESRPYDFPAPPVVRGYSLGSNGVVSATTCDGTSPLGLPSPIVTPCADGGNAGDAGTSCSPILTLAGGGTCTL